MNRREFLGSSMVWANIVANGAAATGERSSPSREQLLAPINLAERIRLGQNALLGGLDPSQKDLPYWSCRYDSSAGFSAHHSGCRDHDVGRALHGLSMAEEITGWRVDDSVYRHLADYLFALFDAGDGLPGTFEEAAGKRVVHLHNIREAINGLTALIKRDDSQARQLAKTLVATLRGLLDDQGKLQRDRLPSYVGEPKDQASQEGRSVDALVRYYRVTGNPTALETAHLITSFALENCFTADGELTPVAGSHGHSINTLVAGMLDFALLTNDRVLLNRARRAYDVGLASFNTSFGWSLETVGHISPKAPGRGEVNNTADLLRASLTLGRAGLPEYFSRAERIVRSHLLPAQLLDVTGLSDDPAAKEDHLRSLAARVRGGFAFTAPNDATFGPNPSAMVYDITSGAVDGLCEAWRHIINKEASGLRVNLLLSASRHEVEVKSYLSGEGRIEVVNRSGHDVLVHLPTRAAADVTVEGHIVKTVHAEDSPWLQIRGSAAPVRATIRFRVPESRTVEEVFKQKYTIDWRGDQIVGMCPVGKYLPMFPPCQ